MRRLCLAVLLFAFAAPAFGQAPRITPSGDPSVKNDTIYKLAVNPADHPDDDFIYLLDDGVIRFEADGRGSRTYRQVVQMDAKSRFQKLRDQRNKRKEEQPNLDQLVADVDHNP